MTQLENKTLQMVKLYVLFVSDIQVSTVHLVERERKREKESNTASLVLSYIHVITRYIMNHEVNINILHKLNKCGKILCMYA